MKFCISKCSHRLSYLKKTTMQQVNNNIIDDENEEFEGELPYCFYPSVTRTVSVNGKPYTVKSYFTGGKDFRAAVKQLAIKRAYKQAR